MAAEHRFRAMGSDVHVVTVGGPPDALQHAAGQIAGLERVWSRFLDDSDICRLNTAGGRPCRVSSATFIAVSRSVIAWGATSGRYDPTVQRALVAAGYDRTFEELGDRVRCEEVPAAAPGCAGIELDGAQSTVTLPPGVGVDLGGIGKGLAADLVVERLLDAGCEGACVNVGGDIRVAGEAPSPEGWVVSVESPLDGEGEVMRLALADGAVASSSTQRRRWRVGHQDRHHLLDPRTGLPIDNGLASVTAVAGEAWWAEVLTKAAMVAGPREGASLLTLLGGAGLLVRDDGGVSTSGGLEEFLR